MTRTGRELPDDLRHLRVIEDEDGFQVISSGDAVVGLIVLAVFALIFWPYLVR